MLVQIALIVFALSAMLSLVIDIGYARTDPGPDAERRRYRGARGKRSGNATSATIRLRAIRRAAVNTLVGWQFDDDLDPTNGDPDYQFGAGPIIDLTEGATSAPRAPDDQRARRARLQA